VTIQFNEQIGGRKIRVTSNLRIIIVLKIHDFHFHFVHHLGQHSTSRRGAHCKEETRGNEGYVAPACWVFYYSLNTGSVVARNCDRNQTKNCGMRTKSRGNLSLYPSSNVALLRVRGGFKVADPIFPFGHRPLSLVEMEDRETGERAGCPVFLIPCHEWQEWGRTTEESRRQTHTRMDGTL